MNNNSYWYISFENIIQNDIKLSYSNNIKTLLNVPDPINHIYGVDLNITTNIIPKKIKIKKKNVSYDMNSQYNNYKNKIGKCDNSLKIKRNNYFKLFNKNATINLYNNLNIKLNIKNVFK